MGSQVVIPFPELVGRFIFRNPVFHNIAKHVKTKVFCRFSGRNPSREIVARTGVLKLKNLEEYPYIWAIKHELPYKAIFAEKSPCTGLA